MAWALPLFFFETTPGFEKELKEESSSRTRDEKAILCAFCQYRVSREKERTAVRGSHEHSFFNPHGIVYHIGCFLKAPGCIPSGPPCGEFSWFPGFNWQIVCCGGCQNHLGWQFLGENKGFFGLILNRLTQID